MRGDQGKPANADFGMLSAEMKSSVFGVWNASFGSLRAKAPIGRQHSNELNSAPALRTPHSTFLSPVS